MEMLMQYQYHKTSRMMFYYLLTQHTLNEHLCIKANCALMFHHNNFQL